MQTKNPFAQARKVITPILLLIGVCFLTFGAGIAPIAHAQEAFTSTPAPSPKLEHATPTELTSNERDDISTSLRTVMDAYLTETNDNRTYDFWIGKAFGDWVEISVWYLQLDGQPIGMGPLTLIANKENGKDWKIYTPWNEDFNFAVDRVPAEMFSESIKSILRVPDTIQSLSIGQEVVEGHGGFLFPWSGTKQLSRLHNNYEFDIANNQASFDILAPKDGEIVYRNDDTPNDRFEDCASMAPANNYVVLGHGRKTGDDFSFYTLYYHLANNSIPDNLVEGSRVRTGQKIGEAGTTGWSTGVHLHFTLATGIAFVEGDTWRYCDSTKTESGTRDWPVARGQTQIGFQEFGNIWSITSPLPASWNRLDLNQGNCNPQTDPVIVYRHRDFGGECEVFAGDDNNLLVGDYPQGNYIGNDSVSSVLVKLGNSVLLYQDDGFGLPSLPLEADTADLRNTYLGDWNDRASSLKVGINQCLQAGGLQSAGMNLDITSISCGGPTPTLIPTQPNATLPPPSGGIEIVNVSSHVVKPGEQFNPSITIRRLSGELVANRDHLHAIPEDASNTFGAWPVQPLKSNVPIGGTYTFDVNNDTGFRMTAPTTPGQYQSAWQMRVNGLHVGPQAVINITVQSDPIVTPPTPLPINCIDPPEGITLYEFTDFRGRCINFTSDVMYLGNTYFGNDVASSLRVVGNWGVTLFRDPDWNGSWQEFSSDDNNLSDNQIGDNTVSSLRVWQPGNPCATLPQGVTLYRGRDFTGISQSFRRDAQFLGNETIGDNTANSLRICGPYRVTLYRDPDWTGLSEEFTGSDANLTDDPINDPNPTTSSLRIVDVNDACNSLPPGVTLYSEMNFGGRSQTFSSDVMYLGNTSFGNDAAKSVRVCGHWKVTIFRDPDWTGQWEEFFGPDINLSDNPTGLNTASSIRMVDSYDFCRTLGTGVTLYRGRDFTGIAQTFTRDAQFLGNEPIGNDTVTSIRQCGYNSRLYRDPDWQGFSEEFTGREESNLTDNQISTTSSSLRVWTIPPTPTPTVTPTPTPVPAKPDLVPYDGNGLAFPLIPSSMPGDHWVGMLYAGQVTYLDWGIFNNSNVNVTTPFKVKLFLDGNQINEFSYTSLDANSYHGIDDWNIYVDTPGYHTLKIFVDSNHDITESNENNNSWQGSFYWNPIPQPPASCPLITSWKGEYWANDELSGPPALCRNDLEINFNWEEGSPDPIIPADHFSARWTRTLNFDTGLYRFHIDHDDGARIYIDNVLVPGGDFSNTCCKLDSVDKQLQAGNHTIRLEIFELGGSANVQLWWEQIDQQVSIFSDVPNSYWAWSYIERLYAAGITSGCNPSPLMYCPTTIVTRDQMAVFLLRGKHTSSYTPPPATGIFMDVPSDYWSAAWIEQLAAEGITFGCNVSPKQYCPTTPVTRDQMAVFLLRAKHGSDYVPPEATGEFQDVPRGYWAADWIEQLADEGITSGCSASPMLYCPTTPVTRDQMAVFLVKNFNLP